MEWEHNLSQQIYVSTEIWDMVRSTKEEMIMTINRIGMQLPPNAPSKEFSIKLYEYLNELDGTLPTHRTLAFIKKDVLSIL
jgi:hypothetical protein